MRTESNQAHIDDFHACVLDHNFEAYVLFQVFNTFHSVHTCVPR